MCHLSARHVYNDKSPEDESQVDFRNSVITKLLQTFRKQQFLCRIWGSMNWLWKYIFPNIKPYSLLNRHRRFGGTYCLSVLGIYTKIGGSTFLRNVGNDSQTHTPSYSNLQQLLCLNFIPLQSINMWPIRAISQFWKHPISWTNSEQIQLHIRT
jgi:hypothetical protein